MKTNQFFSARLLTVQFFLFFQSVQAQAAELWQVEALFEYAEDNASEYFFPPNQSTRRDVEGWLYRYFGGTRTYAAVNLASGDVWVQGGGFGDDPLYIDSLLNLVTQIGVFDTPPQSGHIVDPGSNTCRQLPLPPAGVTISYASSITDASGQMRPFSVERTIISSTDKQLVQEDVFAMPGFVINNEPAVLTQRDTWQYYNYGDLRYLTGSISHLTGEIPSGTSVSEKTYAYRSPVFLGPRQTLCDSMEWDSDQILGNLSTVETGFSGSQRSSSVTISSRPTLYQVSAITEQLTTVSGTTFTTVKIVENSHNLSSSLINWIDVDTGVLIRQETRSPDLSVLIAVMELQTIVN